MTWRARVKMAFVMPPCWALVAYLVNGKIDDFAKGGIAAAVIIYAYEAFVAWMDERQ